MRNSYVNLTLLVLAATAVATGGTAIAAVQAAHRAVYDLTLQKAEKASGVDNVDGRMVFEVAGSACEGYSVTFRLVNRYSYTEGASRLVDVQSTTYEAGDGNRFDYQEQETVDNAAAPEKRTIVERKEAGSAPIGEIVKPEAKNFSLPTDVLFPMQHQLKVIDAAAAGQSRFSASVFDGSEDVNPAQAVATIGARIAPGSGKDMDNPKAAPLRQLASWPVVIAYFPPGREEETPSFQVGFTLYENGVASNMTLDYGNMTLKGKLVGLEMLKAAECK